jgi:hypothetical protein
MSLINPPEGRDILDMQIFSMPEGLDGLGLEFRISGFESSSYRTVLSFIGNILDYKRRIAYHCLGGETR